MKTTKKLNDGKIKLTKSNINDGYIREFINKIEGSDKVLSDEELIEERNKILPSSIQNQNLYVFAYGSLLWNPTIDFEKQVLGKIYGFHRSFCMLTKLGRGSYENPGLMLGLDKGGSCKGILFKLNKKDALKNIDILFKREMVTKAYVPKLLTAHLKNGKKVKDNKFVRGMTYTNFISYQKSNKFDAVLSFNMDGQTYEFIKNGNDLAKKISNGSIKTFGTIDLNDKSSDATFQIFTNP